MTPSEIKRAKELKAQLAGLSNRTTTKKKVTLTSSYKYKSLGGASAPWLSVKSPYVDKSLSEKVRTLGKQKAAVVVEKPVYYGKPGEKGDRGERGNPGQDGKHGKDGKTPIKGIHYFTPMEVRDLRNEIIDHITSTLAPSAEPAVETSTELTVNEELVKQIVQMMHKLPEADKLEVSQGIRNAQSFLYKGTKYGIEEMMHGAGSGGGSVTPLTPSGVVNAANTVFGVLSEPSSVVSDGITYYEGFGYSYAANVITLDVPPSQYIRYYA